VAYISAKEFLKEAVTFVTFWIDFVMSLSNGITKGTGANLFSNFKS